MFEGDYPPGVTGREPELNGIDEMWIPDDCCGYCTHYCGDVCAKEWNNGDDSYYVPERDDKDEDDCCDDYEWNEKLLELPKEPKKGDKIYYDGVEYEVLAPQKEPVWRWSGTSHLTRRIHTKEIGKI